MEEQYPTLRVFLLGTCLLELPDGTRPAIETVVSRSHATILFKLLLCHPQRQVSRDLLIDTIWPGHSSTSIGGSLDVAKSVLSTGLHRLCGCSLVPRVQGDPPRYGIAGQSVLWTDLDACAEAIALALSTDDGSAALAQWEAAYQLLQRGDLLAEDQHAYWYSSPLVHQRRSKLVQQRVQCAVRIADLSLECGNITRAQAVLTAEAQADPANEAVLFPLLNLLAALGQGHDALAWYARLESALLERGTVPREETQRLALQLRAHGVRYSLAGWSAEESGVSEQVTPSSRATHGTAFSLSPQSLPMEQVTRSVELPRSPLLLGNLLTDQNAALHLSHPPGIPVSVSSLMRTDLEILADLATALHKPSVVHERELRYFDQQTRHYWQAREEAALPTITLYTSVIRHSNDITLLLGRSHQPLLRCYLCEIACRTVLLAGILLYDMGQYVPARQYYEIALQAASEAHNLVLQAIVWGWMSFTWTYTKHYPEALSCVQQARSLALRTMERGVQTWLGAIEAEIQVHLHNAEMCLHALREMERGMGASPSQDTSYLFEFNQVLLLGYKGVCLQHLYHRHKPETHHFLHEAKVSLQQALASEAPLKRKLYYITDLAGVYTREGEIEQACTSVAQSIPLIVSIGSGSKTLRSHLFQVRSLLHPYEQTACVQALDQQMGPLLIEMRAEEK